MRQAAIALMMALTIPCWALWVESEAASELRDRFGTRMTFSAGDFLEDGRHGWLAGSYRAPEGLRGVILRTRDGGHSWGAVASGLETTPVSAIDFVDANHGWLLQGDQSVYYTEDGGETWTWTPGFGIDHALRDLQGVDADHAFIAGEFGDPGRACVFSYGAAEQQWDRWMVEAPGALESLAATGLERMWAAGLTPEGTALGYRRRGGEWREMTIPSSVQSLSAVSSIRGYAGCTSGRIFKTMDAAASWEEMSTPVLADLDEVHFSSSNDGVALSESGQLLLVTEDGGEGWTVERTPEQPRDLMWDGTEYWLLTAQAVYERQEILLPEQTPETAAAVNPQPARILDLDLRLPAAPVWREATELVDLLTGATSGGTGPRMGYRLWASSFLDDGRHGWFHGTDTRNLRVLLRTRSGGELWELVEPTGERPLSFSDMVFVDENNGWVCGGDAPFIARTEDGGETWAPERMRGDGASSIRLVRELAMVDAESGFAVADRDDVEDDLLLQRRADGVWEAIATVDNFASLEVDSTGFLWIGAHTRRLLAGPDPAELDTILEVSIMDGIDIISELLMHSRYAGWVLPRQSTHMLRTTNGGDSWEHKRWSLDPAEYAVDAAMMGAAGAWVLTRMGRVLHTVDGGDTWNQVHELAEEIDPWRSSIHAFGSGAYVAAGREIWTNVPPRGPAEASHELEPARPQKQRRLLTWSEDDRWAGDGRSPDQGMVGRETVFRVRWDRGNARAPGRLMLQVRDPHAELALPYMVDLRPADYWEMRETGAGDWGVGFTPSQAGRYEYRFWGMNADGENVRGEPTQWRVWRVR